MAKDINVVVIEGRLARDAEVSTTRNGTEILKISIANDDSYSKNGDLIEGVNWVNIQKWKPHSFLKDNLSQGTHVTVEGKLKQESYKTEDGRKMSFTYIDARMIQVHLKEGSSKNRTEVGSNTADDDDLPF